MFAACPYHSQAVSDSEAPEQKEESDPTCIFYVSPGEEGILRPNTITGGDAHIRQHIEQPIVEISETILSLSLLLAAEQQTRPHVDIATLKAEPVNNENIQNLKKQAPGQ